MKYLFVIALFAFVALIVYWRLRPYIRAARQFFGFVGEVRRMGADGGGARVERRVQHSGRNSGGGDSVGRGGQGGRASTRDGATQKLVRCTTCGTWLPASRSLSMRSAPSVFYCSHACLERAADAPRPTRRSSAS